jgi:hypothetical protein
MIGMFPGSGRAATIIRLHDPAAVVARCAEAFRVERFGGRNSCRAKHRGGGALACCDRDRASAAAEPPVLRDRGAKRAKPIAGLRCDDPHQVMHRSLPPQEIDGCLARRVWYRAHPERVQRGVDRWVGRLSQQASVGPLTPSSTTAQLTCTPSIFARSATMAARIDRPCACSSGSVQPGSALVVS